MDKLERMNAIEAEMKKRFGDHGKPRFFRAPGRVDLMGSHTDYNGGSILATTVDRDIIVGARPRAGGAINLHSLNTGIEVRVKKSELKPERSHGWANYVKGVLVEAAHAGVELEGMDLVAHGEIPIGGNLSSSAALEAAALEAILALTETTMAPWEKAIACKYAENRFVGMPCGIMDQFTVILGGEDAVIQLDCYNLQYQTARFPRETTTMLVIDSGQGRELVASSYLTRVRECRRALRVLHQRRPAVASLSHATAADLEAGRAELGDVLHRRARHVISENQRVKDAAMAMRKGDARRLGAIMAEGFKSCRDDYENSTKELNALHETVAAMPGVLGARICGAGWGGCLLALVERAKAKAIEEQLPEAHKKKTMLTAKVWAVDPGPAAGPIES